MWAMTEAPSRFVCKLAIGRSLRAFGSVTMIGSSIKMMGSQRASGKGEASNTSTRKRMASPNHPPAGFFPAFFPFLPIPGLGPMRLGFLVCWSWASSLDLSCSICFCSLMSLSTTRLKGAPPFPEIVEGGCVVAVSRTQNTVPSVFTIRSSHVCALPVAKSSLRCR